jgi:hypothetical protein
MKATAQCDFYRGLADLTEMFVKKQLFEVGKR